MLLATLEVVVSVDGVAEKKDEEEIKSTFNLVVPNLSGIQAMQRKKINSLIHKNLSLFILGARQDN